MSNLKFYTVFNIFNILLLVFLYSCIYRFLMFFEDFWDTSDKMIMCGVTFYIFFLIIKTLLPKIFIKLSIKYKNSIFNKFTQFLLDNYQKKKEILAIAFCYDLPFILYYFYITIDFYYGIGSLVAYFLFYLGGILFFYIMLYNELDEMKLKNDGYI